MQSESKIHLVKGFPDNLLVIVPKKHALNGAIKIIDVSRLFLMITSGKALGTTTDTTTLSRSARLRFSLPIRMSWLVLRFENIPGMLKENAVKKLRNSYKVFN